jgi:hypothetical protein
MGRFIEAYNNLLKTAGRGDQALNWIRNTKLVNPAGKVETLADSIHTATGADSHSFYKSIVRAVRNHQDTQGRKMLANVIRSYRAQK